MKIIARKTDRTQLKRKERFPVVFSQPTLNNTSGIKGNVLLVTFPMYSPVLEANR